jgi:methylenetetrahydrofolate dehydrogenase (NADP+)/methenyltetrahydrofolate cyclohydrolase
MTGELLDGKALAGALEAPLARRVAALRDAGHPAPALAVLLAGADRRAAANARLKADACARIGLDCRLLALPDGTGTSAVLAEVDRLNADPRVHGIFLQYPLGGEIDERRCGDRIGAAKDVDGAGSSSFGRLAAGGEGFGVATPEGILRLLAHHGIAIAGREAVVVGTGTALGRPMALMLLRADATVTLCPTDSPHLAALVGRAEVVVGAAGQSQLIKARWIGDGAVVIDLGFHRGPPPAGDVEMTPELGRRCRAWTPVPGGAGPMTVAVLLAHTVEAAERASRGGAVRTAR